MFEKCNRDQVPERRVKRWGFSCWELLKDPIGHDHFKSFLEKEYATENLLFVEAVWNMKKLAQRDVADECRRIWQQFFATGADMLVSTTGWMGYKSKIRTHALRYCNSNPLSLDISIPDPLNGLAV